MTVKCECGVEHPLDTFNEKAFFGNIKKTPSIFYKDCECGNFIQLTSNDKGEFLMGVTRKMDHHFTPSRTHDYDYNFNTVMDLTHFPELLMPKDPQCGT